MGQFFTSLLSIVGIVREMIKLIHLLLDMVSAQKEKAAAEREKSREAAVDCLKNAKTEAEFDKCQSTVVDNNP